MKLHLLHSHAPTAAVVNESWRVAQGHSARSHGGALEDWLEGQHDAARGMGIAHVVKVGEPFKRVGKGGRTFVVTGKAPPDYLGVIRGGRALAIEAKAAEGRLLRSKIPDHQAAYLARVESLGGIALLVYEDRREGEIYAMPWGHVPWRVLRTAEGIAGPECAEWRVVSGRCYLERFVSDDWRAT